MSEMSPESQQRLRMSAREPDLVGAFYAINPGGFTKSGNAFLFSKQAIASDNSEFGQIRQAMTLTSSGGHFELPLTRELSIEETEVGRFLNLRGDGSAITNAILRHSPYFTVTEDNIITEFIDFRYPLATKSDREEWGLELIRSKLKVGAAITRMVITPDAPRVAHERDIFLEQPVIPDAKKLAISLHDFKERKAKEAIAKREANNASVHDINEYRTFPPASA